MRTSASVEEAVDRGIAQIGLTSSVQAAYQVIDDRAATDARMTTAFTTIVDGVKLDELVGGYGVAEAALAAMDRKGMEPGATRAVIQGFGSMGGATARGSWPEPGFESWESPTSTAL